jgi:hypothetical protein
LLCYILHLLSLLLLWIPIPSDLSPLSTVAAFAAFGASSAFASQIGTGTVTGSGGLTTAINWNDAIPGSASGTINGIIVKAKVRPILNMAISADTIDLGYLNPTTYTSGSVAMEIGTNASAGASVTAKSLNGGMLSASGDILNTISSLTVSLKATSGQPLSAWSIR